MKATVPARPPICVRLKPETVRAMDEAAHCHGWTRTTWIRRALASALAADREFYRLDVDRSYENARAYDAARPRRS